MWFEVQIVSKAVDNIAYSGFSSLVWSVCKLLKWHASKQGLLNLLRPLKRNTSETWIWFLDNTFPPGPFSGRFCVDCM